MTIEQLEKINWLNRAYYADKRVKSLEAIQTVNKSLAEKCTVSYERVGTSGGNNNSQEKILHQLCDNDIEIEKELQNLVEIRKEISRAISSLDNDVFEAILNMRYLAYKTIQQIADELNYDKRTIQRKHKSALDRMSLNVTLDV